MMIVSKPRFLLDCIADNVHCLAIEFFFPAKGHYGYVAGAATVPEEFSSNYGEIHKMLLWLSFHWDVPEVLEGQAGKDTQLGRS